MVSSKQEKGWSAAVTLLFTIILVTPLCGFLFKCGCDWPWSGLSSDCNIAQPNAIHTCPWCASLVSGALSVGFAISAGILASMTVRPSPGNQLIYKITARSLFGVMMFLVVATLAAVIAATWQSYPLGVGGFLQ